MRQALLLSWVLLGCARVPHAGLDGRVAFEVESETAELGSTPVATGTELRLTLRWVDRGSVPEGVTLVSTSGDALIALDSNRVSVTEVRDREVLRARVTFRAGPVTLEARTSTGAVLDRLVVQVITPSALRAGLDAASRCAQLTPAGDRLSVVPGTSTALLDFVFVDAAGQRLLGTPNLASACLGVTERRCLPTSGSRLSVEWSPTPGELLSGAIATFFTFGLATGTSTSLTVSDASGASSTVIVDDRGTCAP
jgi:hypothetical protein